MGCRNPDPWKKAAGPPSADCGEDRAAPPRRATPPPFATTQRRERAHTMLCNLEAHENLPAQAPEDPLRSQSARVASSP